MVLTFLFEHHVYWRVFSWMLLGGGSSVLALLIRRYGVREWNFLLHEANLDGGFSPEPSHVEQWVAKLEEAPDAWTRQALRGEAKSWLRRSYPKMNAEEKCLADEELGYLLPRTDTKVD